MKRNSMDVLPDSRLLSDIGSVMGEWAMPDGSKVRCECVPVYCANCGADKGFVPKENTTWAFFLCDDCFETWGLPAGMMVQSDHDFCEAVAAEMQAKYGRPLTGVELAIEADRGTLGKPLEALIKDSPYKGKT